jgi:hypothetical protein
MPVALQRLRDGLAATGFLSPDAFLSANPLPLAKCPQTDEPDFPPHLCLNGLAGEPDSPRSARPVANGKLAKAVELQRESIRAQAGGTLIAMLGNHVRRHLWVAAQTAAQTLPRTP